MSRGSNRRRPLRRLALIMSLVAVGVGTGPGLPLPASRAEAADTAPTTARATLIGTDGKPAGAVVLTTVGDHLRVEVAATGLSPGFHGFHLHSKGLCDPAATRPSAPPVGTSGPKRRPTPATPATFRPSSPGPTEWPGPGSSPTG